MMKSYVKATITFNSDNCLNLCHLLFENYEQLLNYLCRESCTLIDYELMHLIKHRKEFKKNV